VAHMHPLIPRFFSISLSLLLPCIVGIWPRRFF
jgi:hypothetical protein